MTDNRKEVGSMVEFADNNQMTLGNEKNVLRKNKPRRWRKRQSLQLRTGTNNGDVPYVQIQDDESQLKNSDIDESDSFHDCNYHFDGEEHDNPTHNDNEPPLDPLSNDKLLSKIGVKATLGNEEKEILLLQEDCPRNDDMGYANEWETLISGLEEPDDHKWTACMNSSFGASYRSENNLHQQKNTSHDEHQLVPKTWTDVLLSWNKGTLSNLGKKYLLGSKLQPDDKPLTLGNEVKWPHSKSPQLKQYQEDGRSHQSETDDCELGIEACPIQEPDDWSDVDELTKDSPHEIKYQIRTQSTSKAVGKLGSRYEGDFDGMNMSGLGTLYSGDMRQFIQGVWNENKLCELHSSQFIDLREHPHEWTIYLRKQKNGYLMNCDEDEFVARVQLRCPDQVDFNLPFNTIKQRVFQNLKITKVIEDRLQSTRKSDLTNFERTLTDLLHNQSSSLKFASLLITLNKYSRYDDSTKKILNRMIESNDEDLNELRDAAGKLLLAEQNLVNMRLKAFKFSSEAQPPELGVKSIVQTAHTKAINRLRQSLLDKCPSTLPNLTANIRELSPDKIIYVTIHDIELFHHLAHLATMTEECVLTFVNKLLLGFFEKLGRITSDDSPNVVMPLSSPVYGFLFKSFLEIISEIGHETKNCSVSTTFSRDDNFKLIGPFIWNQEQKPQTRASLTGESLECKYRFIYKLLCRFDPRSFDPKYNFGYQFKILFRNYSDGSGRFQKFKRFVVGGNNHPDIPQDRGVWLYLLDHTMYNVLIKNHDYPLECFELFRSLLDGLIIFIREYPTNSSESFRLVTHNVLMFIIQVIPDFKNTYTLSEKDKAILGKQMNYIREVSINMKNDSSASSDFRNLIDECSRYWSLRHLVMVDKARCPEYLVSKIQKIHEVFLELVAVSLDKNVPCSSLVKYFRGLNDFISDFKDINFPSNWYIKSKYFSFPGVIEKVDNKLASETNCSYKVINLKDFIKSFPQDSPPQHYIIQIVSRLLECAIKSLTKTWISNSQQSVAQLEATGALLGAMRQSFLYLKEQPEYRDFDLFENESVQPFNQVVDRCHVLSEFIIRVEVVKESFWYLRKMDEIGIDQALKLFAKLNPSTEQLKLKKLKQCYDCYLLKYNAYIAEAKQKGILNDGIDCIVESVNTIKEDPKAVLTDIGKWDERFKSERLPTILAGLSAVWSLLVSKDISSSCGKFLKPHCIQILCVMRLLSVDEPSRGVEHHLAEVLTGQGKSVVLGLLSAILAFTGYEVRVLCYSKYLAMRDEEDFQQFFNTLNLNITHCIKYGTFGDMANEFVNPIFRNKQVSLRDLVKSIVLEHCSLENLGTPSSDVSRTVLLIDEVDVFFSEQYFGNTYNPCVRVPIPGLSVIQEKIWETASRSRVEQDDLYSLIERFIGEGVRSGNQELEEYNKFVQISGEIRLLIEDDKQKLIETKFTNKSLLEKHIKDMIMSAIYVSKGKTSDWYINNYKIVDEIICCLKSVDGVYSPSEFSGYLNTFNYFRLKKVGFDHMDYSNYGYILLDTGRISYAKLPEEFPLIMGVSGTVSSLSGHEKKSIGSLKLNSFSVLPSFFGDSNLKFDKIYNFEVLDSEKKWGDEIFNHIQKVLKEHRAVLVFFNTYLNLNNFQMEYRNKFDRLNILTENSRNYLKCVEEAGISNSVTLCTRMMGRGVDFKSSLAVEEKGGVHVIQTFFSLDVKEETQIKGRTARKDNKGSYELILCKKHLIESELVNEGKCNTLSYSSLHQTRLHLMATEGAENEEKITNSAEDHKSTMKFFGIGTRKFKKK